MQQQQQKDMTNSSINSSKRRTLLQLLPITAGAVNEHAATCRKRLLKQKDRCCRC
jgi:hypothetical protein